MPAADVAGASRAWSPSVSHPSQSSQSSPPPATPVAPLTLVSPSHAGATAGEAASRWELEGLAGGDRDRCAAFLGRLEAMTCAEWLQVGRRCGAAELAARGASADAALRALVDARGLAVTAWFVRDAVESAAAAAPGALEHGAPTAGERTLLAAARAAAWRAALAQLARPWLSATDHRALLAPFVALVGVAGST